MQLANWVQETTATTGTGTISMGGAVSSFIPFSAAGIVSGSTVMYEIKDGNNRERGFGTLTSGSPWTLARTQVVETLVSGTLTRFGSPISLSGSATVTLAASADMFQHNRPPPPQSGSRYMLPIDQNPDTTFNTGANQCNYLVFYNRLSSVYTHIGVRTTTQAVGKARIGIYSDRPEIGGIGPLICQSNDFDTNVLSRQEVALTASTYLPAGWYVAGFLCDNTGWRPTAKGFGYPEFETAEMDLGSNTRGRHGWIQFGLSGWSSMPASPSPTIWDFGANIVFYLKGP